METFSALLTICAGNFPHKGQWRGTLMFSLICARINCWVNNGETGDLRRHRAHYGVIVMKLAWVGCWMDSGPTGELKCHDVAVIKYDVHIKYNGKNIERHTAHTIVSWPNPKQWAIVHFRFDDDNKTKYIFSQSSQGRWLNWKHTAPYIVKWITERICLISLTHSTKYIWQTFYKFNVFR